MPSTQALLIDIHFPDGSESLRFMTGRDFEMLRQDKNGREIYGLRHNEKEYLFLPFSFKPVDAGVLSLRLPPEYEESYLDHRAHGARIVFGSVHGVPFFPEMPDAFQTNTGKIDIDASGAVRILLDKAEPGNHPGVNHDCGCGHEHHSALGPDSERHHGDCGCGNDGHGGHGHVEGHSHVEECGCRSHDVNDANDAELASEIRLAAKILNATLRLGHKAGLSIHVDADEDGEKCPQVRIRQIARPL